MYSLPPEIIGFYLITGYFTFTICRWIYRISPLHPLAKIPTPSKFACASQLYEFYWNVIQDGQFVLMIEKWHKELGPVIRIAPNQVHVNNPVDYETVYMSGYKFTPDGNFYNSLKGALDSFLGQPQSIHRSRRGAMNPFFAKASINKATGNILAQVDKLASIMSADAKIPGKGTYVSSLFLCLVADVICDYAYGESLNTLDQGADAPLCTGVSKILTYIWLAAWTWPIQHVAALIPGPIMNLAIPKNLTGAIAVTKLVDSKADEFMTDFAKAKEKSGSHVTIFETLLNGSTSSFKPTKGSIVGDAATVITAGMATTRETLVTAIFEACSDKAIQEKLYQELVEAFPGGVDEITLAKCEKLPYLIAFVKECLRLVPPAPTPFPRIVPKGGTTLSDIYLPEGTSVGTSTYVLHHNPDVFPNPEKFDPERWLVKDVPVIQEKGYAPVSKGVRMCVGMQFAYAELYLTLAVLLRRFKFSLHPDNRVTKVWVDHLGTDRNAELIVSVEEYGVES